MLRRAAATAAWLLLPFCGYLLSFVFSTTSISTLLDISDSSSDTQTPDKKRMIYTSKSALPSEWDVRRWGRHQPVQQYLKVDGLSVKYLGPGETDAQAASIFADKPVPQDLPLYYFEVTVLNKGDQGFIGVGFCVDEVNLGRLPGWEPHSYGYHGDDGHAFHGSGQGRAFGPCFSTGDVVGALLDRGQNTISFYKNGEFVGTAFHGVTEQRLYPCVGMRTPDEEVCANFGSSPFAVDFAAIQAQFKQRILNSIADVRLPAAVELTAAAPTAAAAAGGTVGASKSSVAAAPVACARDNSSRDGTAAAATADTLEPAAQAALAATGVAETTAAAAGAATGSSTTAATKSSWSQPLVPYLIFDYLLHQRCWRTAAIVARDMLGGMSSSSTVAQAAAGSGDATAAPMECGSSSTDTTMTEAAAAAANTAADATCSTAAGALSEADIQDALQRQQIFDAIAAGQLSNALSQVHAHYSSAVLEMNPKLAFKLKVQQFIELIRQASDISNEGDAGRSSSSSSSTSCFEVALAYARAELGPASMTADDEELLSDALSLLAYSDPAASPCGYLLRPAQRVQLAEELNGALLKVRGTSAQPLLESMYRQAVVLLDELKRHHVPQALVLDVAGLCLRGEAAHLQRHQQKQGDKGRQAGGSAGAAGRHTEKAD